jgi:hypothetical protein
MSREMGKYHTTHGKFWYGESMFAKGNLQIDILK